MIADTPDKSWSELTAEERISSRLAQWISDGRGLMDHRDYIAARLKSDYLEITERKGNDEDYNSAVVIGIQNGFDIVLENKTLRDVLNNRVFFSEKLSYLLETIAKTPELSSGLKSERFHEIATVQLKNSYGCVEDDVKTIANSTHDLGQVLASAVSAHMEERETDRQDDSAYIVRNFHDTPDVLTLADPETIDITCEGEVNLIALSSVAKALKTEARFKSCINPKDIEEGVKKLYARGKHDEAQELYENIKNIPEFEQAFMGEYSDIIHLGLQGDEDGHNKEGITLAFNVAGKSSSDQPQMSVFVGRDQFDSLQALNKDQKDTPTVMRVAWAMTSLSQGLGLPDFAEGIRMQSKAGQLATMAQDQLNNLSNG